MQWPKPGILRKGYSVLQGTGCGHSHCHNIRIGLIEQLPIFYHLFIVILRKWSFTPSYFQPKFSKLLGWFMVQFCIWSSAFSSLWQLNKEEETGVRKVLKNRMIHIFIYLSKP